MEVFVAVRAPGGRGAGEVTVRGVSCISVDLLLPVRYNSVTVYT